MARSSSDTDTTRSQQSKGSTVETLVVRGKAAWSSDIDTDVVVEATGRLAVSGDVDGKLELRPGARAAIKGNVHGDMFIGEGARLAVKGSCTGSITNRGGSLALDDSPSGGSDAAKRWGLISGGLGVAAAVGVGLWLTRSRW